MKKIAILTILCILVDTTSATAFVEIQNVEKIEIGVPSDRNAAIIFPATIISFVVGNKDYEVEKEDEKLYIHATSSKAKRTTLHVTYGERKKLFSADIFVDESAPSERKINFNESTPTETSKSFEGSKEVDAHGPTASLSKQAAEIFPPNEDQAYCDLGQKKDGIKVILTNIAHHGDATYFKIYIENNTTTKLNLATIAFEYVSYQRRFLVFRTKKNEPVPVLFASDTLEVGPQSNRVFVFAISTFITDGGLEILMQEDRKKGHRDFRFLVPLEVLLYATRK
jgi:Domain of unknown function (DUF4138)